MLKTTAETILPEIDRAVEFIREQFAAARKLRAVVAVSGGIDSAVVLTLAVKALGAEAVTALLLPYGEQDMADAQLIAEFNGLTPDQILTLPITTIVQAAAATTTLATIGELGQINQLRLGNLMARSRMMVIFDQAKKLGALVCGTENKSEHFLGYFTRFGDEASDLEPITNWWKTEVRSAAQALKLPHQFLEKAPSAGLWQGQTDEAELGFSYEQADQVLAAWVEWSQTTTAAQIGMPELSEIATAAQVSSILTEQVLARVTQTQFKRQTPYRNETDND
ncbi:MAG TPA: NAD(+) synthase [Candidatus Pacebacteria bacterium]|nr:NAD(+) synthase [Candidatus Paceibacterota bacterium]